LEKSPAAKYPNDVVWSESLEERVAECVRSFADRQTEWGGLIEDFLDEDGAAGGIRFAFDLASAEGLDVTDYEKQVARTVIENLNYNDRHEAGFATSLKNSLKLIELRNLIAA